MSAHSSSFSGPGRCKDRVRDRELADVVQLCGESQLSERLVAQAEPRAHDRRELCDSLDVVEHARLALPDRPQEHLVRLIAPDVELVLLRIETLVGETQSGARISGLLGQEGGAERGSRC